MHLQTQGTRHWRPAESQLCLRKDFRETCCVSGESRALHRHMDSCFACISHLHADSVCNMTIVRREKMAHLLKLLGLMQRM
jgi:hypothetical protein